LVGLLAAGTVLTGCGPAPESSSRTVHASGATPFLTVVENDVHGPLTRFEAYYQDGYVHATSLPRGSSVTDLEHFTCVNPENHGPSCAASGSGNDAVLTADPENLGLLGQLPTGANHNRLINFNATGTGKTLQWRTYEHKAHTQLSLLFADGFELYIALDRPTHLDDIHLIKQPTTATAVSHAMQTANDQD
jgi:hypothetical protein